ncbi:MAG TPA: Rieske 2Fe-2S domain-containing protein [Thermoplasmata archaeon]|nr:Rieske 2Fe-2S domain-containing protein [Thermoplasmata archaeon]
MSAGFDCRDSCPFSVSRSPALDFPVGHVRRFSAGNADASADVDETKRNVLKLLAVGGLVGAGAGGLVGGAIQYIQPPTIGLSSYPRVQLLDVDGGPLTVAKVEAEYNVETSALYLFNYPLRNEPNFLLNLYPASGTPNGQNGAENVPGGVGTHGSIVAFSGICQHLGCPAPAIAYYPPNTCPDTPGGKAFYLHCSCHGSTYDPANGASNLTGPAVLPLPQVVLEADASGNLFATGMTSSSPPVNGHISTLTGDYGVGSTSQLVKETPVILCNFPS